MLLRGIGSAVSGINEKRAMGEVVVGGDEQNIGELSEDEQRKINRVLKYKLIKLFE